MLPFLMILSDHREILLLESNLQEFSTKDLLMVKVNAKVKFKVKVKVRDKVRVFPFMGGVAGTQLVGGGEPDTTPHQDPETPIL